MAGNELTLQLINSGVTIGNSGIVAESMMLNQAILNSGEFKLGGCIASCFSLQVFDPGVALKGEEIQVYIKEEGDDTNRPLFHGKITDAKKNNDTGTITITAYDALGVAAERQWGGVGARKSPAVSRKEMISALEHVSGVKVSESKQYEEFTLPDVATIELSRWYELMQKGEGSPLSIEILRQMCELNCTFGFIDGEGVFRELEIYNHFSTLTKTNTIGSTDMYLHIDEDGTKPKVTAGNTYTIMSDLTSGQTVGDNGLVTVSFYNADDGLVETVSGYTPFSFSAPDGAAYVTLTTYYSSSNWADEWTWVENKNAINMIPMQNTSHEDYITDKITGVKYFTETVAADGAKSYSEVLFGTGENPYVISDNYVFKLHGNNQQIIAEDLYKKIRHIPQFTPVERMPSLGHPEIGVGDLVSNGNVKTFVFERTLTGIQGLRDTYVADVDKTMPVIEATSQTCSNSYSESSDNTEETAE